MTTMVALSSAILEVRRLRGVCVGVRAAVSAAWVCAAVRGGQRRRRGVGVRGGQRGGRGGQCACWSGGGACWSAAEVAKR